ncbi:MAG: MoxR family ATPase [Lachnospiraceae bacterium]|nr:MoxR family ATPase [Lachnospiraceae bacterium]
MNIKQAKEYIEQTVRIYLKKNELGDYVIPVVRQRPVFMLGAPGVGKTAIMEQIAEELSVALVSYSMTHHTRQSAIGLPFIKKQTYAGEEFDVTEYTMSEIIASIYETMEESGIREGILFLDEINCVSETLAPSMLQFLQYKIFGRHRVPEGWVIVTAGNPPEYNRSVREFDVAVLDRMKVLNVDPDYSVFKEYASERSLHPAIVNFLDMKREYFYKIENTVNGRSYVTARGWEDLSEIIKLYEEEGLKVTDTLIDQYIKNERAVREFDAYYDLFNKYKKDYRIEEILLGEDTKASVQRAKQASFDERLSLLSMLMDRLKLDIKNVVRKVDYISYAAPVLKGCSGQSGNELIDYIGRVYEGSVKKLSGMKRAGSLSQDEEYKLKKAAKLFLEIKKSLVNGSGTYEDIKRKYNGEVMTIKKDSDKASGELENVFGFSEEAFEGGNELLILLTELTVNPYTSRFIAKFGSEGYEKHQSELMITERQIDMQAEARELLKYETL